MTSPQSGAGAVPFCASGGVAAVDDDQSQFATRLDADCGAHLALARAGQIHVYR